MNKGGTQAGDASSINQKVSSPQRRPTLNNGKTNNHDSFSGIVG